MLKRCSDCGSTDPEDVDTLDGYSACCNEPVETALEDEVRS
jgi:hypothetical protein